MTETPAVDVLIIGSGAAGLTAALRLPTHLKVTLLSKGAINSGSTPWAQGGIAAALGGIEDVEQHVHDTCRAGSDLPDVTVVRRVVASGARQIDWLRSLGMPFSSEDAPGETGTEQLHLTREGGHGTRRVAHAADHTGRTLVETLLETVYTRPNITLLEHQLAVDLITTHRLGLNDQPNRCVGAYVLDLKSDHVHTLRAGHVILATGGAAKAYLYTTNPDSSTGDGIAMGWRAGCRVANMEFMQFHPTCLFEPRAKSFLISEAVRGEGGVLLLPDGTRFMPGYHPDAELAPRDVVARAIDSEMKRTGADCVYLDISFKGKAFIEQHFPMIHARCLQYGYDMTRQPLPVVPAAHYTCGGIVVDEHGCTDIAGLYAIGETSHTGLHGANRLASNSLLECLVYGEAAAADIAQRHETDKSKTQPFPVIPDWDDSQVTDPDEAVIVSHNWDELRRAMWDYVGIVRTTKRLERAAHRIALLRREIQDYYAHFRVSNNLIELRNLVEVADLIVKSALARRESRGLHFTRDFPERNPELAHINTICNPQSQRPPSATKEVENQVRSSL
ncbi:L-aspartate oxidase [Halothiobacillus neapolitanus]|uniref:L-aspartate oxidase n=1 Tax=Halothiobacillus neapolitanus (strain ATCC 23641 / DSM 15147 / CIP 104769 / NCIMB 8539 / c2) TaxID=555778 RepID=D0KYM8_HALNC|nr:L-aspartate oxidase [Halothiobacillus neapolitanus]ACX95551.1 L-aspartate oxidase [Halothiobacillus neapolitanus c2]